MRPRLLSTLLAFLSGYVDTAVFVHMGGLFVAHVTGNFVLLGATVAGAAIGGAHGGTTVLQLIAFPVFFLSAMLAPILADRVSAARRTPMLLWLAAAITGIAGALALLLPAATDAALAMLLVAAMGLLNAAHRMDATLGPPFTVMTGNVTAVAIAAARQIGLSRAPDSPPAGPASSVMLVLVLAFAAGCAAGAFVQPMLGLGAMLVPAGLMALGLAGRGHPGSTAHAKG